MNDNTEIDNPNVFRLRLLFTDALYDGYLFLDDKEQEEHNLKMTELVGKYVEHDGQRSLVTVEFDLDNQTARLLPVQ